MWLPRFRTLSAFSSIPAVKIRSKVNEQSKRQGKRMLAQIRCSGNGLKRWGVIFMSANPYAQYQRVGVETADRGRLLLMLYEGALRFLRRARKSLYDRDLEGANNNLLRAEDIVSELMASLDLENGGKIADGLFRLYDYMYRLLLEANLKKDPQPLDQVEKMLEELRDTWKEALGENGTAAGDAVRAFPGVPREVQGPEKPLIAEAKESYSGYKKGKQVRKDLQEYLLNIIR